MGAGPYSTGKSMATGSKHRENNQSLTLNQTFVASVCKQRAVGPPSLHIGRVALLEDSNSQPLCEIIALKQCLIGYNMHDLWNCVFNQTVLRHTSYMCMIIFLHNVKTVVYFLFWQH